MTRVVIGGGSGLIGRALTASLIQDGIAVDVLTRQAPSRLGDSAPPGVRYLAWRPTDPGSLPDLAKLLSGADAVVNLTGIPVGPWPWTAGRRRAIIASRVAPADHLVAALALIAEPDRPATFVSASGIDGYTDLEGDPGSETTDISTASGFLAEVGRAWEAAADEALALGMRVVTVRTAIVLARGGMLLRLLALPVRLGLGGRYGSGDQWFSWVHLDDLIGTYRLALANERISGPLIGAAPEPIRQRDLAAALARVLHRPNWLPIPAWVLRMVLREEATLLLGSRRVRPARLLESGYSFRFPDLHDALRDALGRST